MKYRLALTIAAVLIGMSNSAVAFAAENEAVIDNKSTSSQNIIIRESEAGMLEEGKVIILTVEKIELLGDLKISVEEGNIEVSGEIMDKDQLEDLLNDDPSINFSSKALSDNCSYIVITVEDESTEASVISIDGPELYLDRTLPYGGYALESVYSNNGMWENTTLDKEEAEKNGVFEYKPITVDSEYVKVVTSPRDKDDSTITRGINIGVGEKSITAGEDTIELDSPAYINEGGYAMLPLRAVSEALGATVNWNEESQSISILSGSRIISMKIGEKTMYVNGTPIPMNTAPEISNSRAFIPVRDMANAFGIKNVEWDEKSSSIILN